MASQTEIIRTYTELTKTEWGGRRGGGCEGGRPSLIDSVKRSAGDVNDWPPPFPRSGASGNAMPDPSMTDSGFGEGGPGATQVMKRRQVHPTHLHHFRKEAAVPIAIRRAAPYSSNGSECANFSIRPFNMHIVLRLCNTKMQE